MLKKINLQKESSRPSFSYIDMELTIYKQEYLCEISRQLRNYGFQAILKLRRDAIKQRMTTGVWYTLYVPPPSKIAWYESGGTPPPMILLPQDKNKVMNCTSRVLSHLEVA